MYQYFNEICEFRQQNSVIRGRQIKTNSPILDNVKVSFENFKKELESKYSRYNNVDFTIEVSQGIGVFPNILHLCILPPRQKVSNGIYTAICFDRSGRGALVGCLESKTNPKGLNTKQRKSKGIELKIDVDGGRPTTKYNDVFENPKEFYYKLNSDSELEYHIIKSLDLCMYNLKLTERIEHLQANDYLITNTEGGIFEKFTFENLQDTRQKIALEINARRGQKKFRNKLLQAYGNECPITGCRISEILEAAHIYPYRGIFTNVIQNGIILRSDIHTLFDLGLLTIEPDMYTVVISDKIAQNSYYKSLSEKRIRLPIEKCNYPSKEALIYHFENIFTRG